MQPKALFAPLLLGLFPYLPVLALDVVGQNADLVVSNVVLAPDGVPRLAAVANGVHPGPLIKASKGDRFNLNVINKLTDKHTNDTSIHWHGFFQRGTTWADGAEGVSQCPIPTGSSFRYKFTGGDQTGTYWYHSHIGTQYCDGLRGPMVIYDKNDPYKKDYDFDDENTVITLADWYHVPSRNLALNGTAAEANSTLINGLGRYPEGPKTPLAVFNVQKDKRYRFRLVSLSCDPHFEFTIDGHDLTVIEADGQLVKPVVVDQITIFAGQRYSFILHANQTKANYWIRARPNVGFGDLENIVTGGINSAILRYVGAPEVEPPVPQLPLPLPKLPLLEPDLHPLSDEIAEELTREPDFARTLQIGRTNGSNPVFTINGTAWTVPPMPIMLQILSGAKNVSELMPKGSIYELKRGWVVELTVPNFVIGAPHPFHLHGHAFSVVKSASQPGEPRNLINPVRRDVVSTGSNTGDTTVIRFVADNPGPWIFHCHIEFHLRDGLAIVFAEIFDEIKAANPVPQSWRDICKAYEAAHPKAISS
ncbi:Cu-oxidase-domain-containing protein [Coprinellus micaceus]|uniref:laccase n=1 Tax=Coprinellus micaceus TaxID=71717 RepID=A0A4Y7TV75_COPMI|nr:Cu-oxidase-domain-containing protein [Coprinellus micaceus]